MIFAILIYQWLLRYLCVHSAAVTVIVPDMGVNFQLSMSHPVILLLRSQLNAKIVFLCWEKNRLKNFNESITVEHVPRKASFAFSYDPDNIYSSLIN